MPSQRISQRDIAARAKVHFTTVSLALRGSPALPVATRERIQQLAREMGYRPDPMLSALQAYRKTVQVTSSPSVIAWINPNKPAADLYKGWHSRLYHQGALQRCEALGYRLEEFCLGEMGATRLNRILQARGIQGLLLPPQPRNRAHINLAWPDYSAVSFGYTLSRPRLHVVAAAQYSASRMAMRQLWSRGYRRVGFVTTHNTDERTDQHFSAAYQGTARRFASSHRIPMLVLADHAAADQQLKTFRKWYDRYRPEAILAHYNRVAEFMSLAGISYETCGLAQVHLPYGAERRSLAGIDQNELLVGTTAVDQLVAMLHRNECGVPETPLRLLVEGCWVDGPSIRARVEKPALSAARWEHA